MTPTKSQLIQSLVDFHAYTGRIPRKDEATISSSVLYPRKHYVQTFGSWNHALIESEIISLQSHYQCDFYQLSICDGCQKSFENKGSGYCTECIDKDREPL